MKCYRKLPTCSCPSTQTFLRKSGSSCRSDRLLAWFPR
jgi:hypothetical protein